MPSGESSPLLDVQRPGKAMTSPCVVVEKQGGIFDVRSDLKPYFSPEGPPSSAAAIKAIGEMVKLEDGIESLDADRLRRDHDERKTDGCRVWMVGMNVTFVENCYCRPSSSCSRTRVVRKSWTK
ncbi:hypothetical protein AVEN_225414-1 [Araneus ventricosus]|uniref:Uncharacterized protein n=1 Tax=Araneus ventricosus TaxID=182803 RepID=A0A4Y2WAR7_ARAVE|nr:hypothetical protein AVEN_225414-1 [Araneus ventricosus]